MRTAIFAAMVLVILGCGPSTRKKDEELIEQDYIKSLKVQGISKTVSNPNDPLERRRNGIFFLALMTGAVIPLCNHWQRNRRLFGRGKKVVNEQEQKQDQQENRPLVDKEEHILWEEDEQ